MNIDQKFSDLEMSADELTGYIGKTDSFMSLPYPMINTLMPYLKSKVWYCTKCNRFHPYAYMDLIQTKPVSFKDYTLRFNPTTKGNKTLLKCDAWRPHIINAIISEFSVTEMTHPNTVIILDKDNKMLRDNTGRTNFARNMTYKLTSNPFILIVGDNTVHIVKDETLYGFKRTSLVPEYIAYLEELDEKDEILLFEKKPLTEDNIYEFAERYPLRSSFSSVEGFPIYIRQKGITLIAEHQIGNLPLSLDAMIYTTRK